jgi:hypothetical protein
MSTTVHDTRDGTIAVYDFPYIRHTTYTRTYDRRAHHCTCNRVVQSGHVRYTMGSCLLAFL